VSVTITLARPRGTVTKPFVVLDMVAPLVVTGHDETC
jgi:hypothetical protein